MKKIRLPQKIYGFTLVEVMITLTILGFILLIIFGVLRLALSSWQKGEEAQQTDQQIRMVEQFLIRQIKSAFPYKFKSSKAEGDYLLFEGTPQRLRFISTYSLKFKRSEGLVLVTYDLRLQNGQGTLFLAEEKVLNKDLLAESYDPESALPLLKYVSDAYFEYYQEEDSLEGISEEWLSDWSAKEKGVLPTAVRFRFNYEKDGEKGQPPEVQLIIHIPASRWEDVRTIRGRRIIPQRPVR